MTSMKRPFLKLMLLVLLAICGALLMSNITFLHKRASIFLSYGRNSSSSSSSSNSLLARQALADHPSSQYGGGGGGGSGGGGVPEGKANSVYSVPRDNGNDVKSEFDPAAVAATAKPPEQAQAPTSFSSSSSSSLPKCPNQPPSLDGYSPLRPDTDKPMATLESEWAKKLKPGGHYHPPDCNPKDRTAIIIPCRNRWSHLRILLNQLIPVLIRQQLSFTLFVMESDQVSHFNKGILLNAGYVESQKYGNYTCFVFHDVDLLPMNDHNLYRCGAQPRHLSVAIDKFQFRLPYHFYFGGVLALSKEQYEKVNGHSNVYFGWGGEDDDIYHRVTARGYKISRMPITKSQFHMIRHQRDKGNEVTAQKLPLVAVGEAVKRMDAEGMRQVQYRKDWVHKTPLFTWIHITINETTVIQNFPDYVREKFKNGLTIEH